MTVNGPTFADVEAGRPALADLLKRIEDDKYAAFSAEFLADAARLDAPTLEKLRDALKTAKLRLSEWNAALAKARASAATTPVADVADGEPPPPPADAEHKRGPYERRKDATSMIIKDQMTKLGNFAAVITANVFEIDAAEVRLAYDISAFVQGKKSVIRVPSADYESMRWVGSMLGAGAVIEPERGYREKLRAAIQTLSLPLRSREVYAITGWRNVRGPSGSRYIYLHAGGAIGAEGAVDGIESSLGSDLSRFKLPTPLTGEALKSGIRAVFDHATLDPTVTVPIVAAAFRAALGGSRATVYLSAKQKTGKSMHAATGQQYFGADMDEERPPASVKTATAMGVAQMMARVGDAVFLFDDYRISGAAHADERQGEKIDYVVRAQFGGAGRRALNRDGTQAATADPRCLLFITGEVIPPGHSLRSRMIVIDLTAPTPTSERSVAMKANARDGVFSGVMAAFIQWLAPRLDALRAEMGDKRAEIADRFTRTTNEHRTAKMLADLSLGVHYLLTFAETAGIPSSEIKAVKRQCWDVLNGLVGAQHDHQEHQDPSLRFLGLLTEVIASHRGHLTRPDGSAPIAASDWGWGATDDGSRRQRPKGEWTPDEPEDPEMAPPGPVLRPCGDCLGYIDDRPVAEEPGRYVWLYPAAALAAVKRLAGSGGESIAMTAEDLPKRLNERGLLAKTDFESRKTYTTRKRIDGKIKSGFICLLADLVSGDDGSPMPEDAVNTGASLDDARAN